MHPEVQMGGRLNVCKNAHALDDGLFCSRVPEVNIFVRMQSSTGLQRDGAVLFVAKGVHMQIIDYFHSENQEHWRAQIARYEWRAAKYLAKLLLQGTFEQFVGKGTLYLLVDGDQLISFVSLAERDCVDVPFSPWIGFVHTAPEYRGHRYVGQLIDHACHAAKEHGAKQVYVCTDQFGLYEKYGFVYQENCLSTFGEDSRIYVCDINESMMESTGGSVL